MADPIDPNNDPITGKPIGGAGAGSGAAAQGAWAPPRTVHFKVENGPDGQPTSNPGAIKLIRGLILAVAPENKGKSPNDLLAVGKTNTRDGVIGGVAAGASEELLHTNALESLLIGGVVSQISRLVRGSGHHDTPAPFIFYTDSTTTSADPIASTQKIAWTVEIKKDGTPGFVQGTVNDKHVFSRTKDSPELNSQQFLDLINRTHTLSVSTAPGLESETVDHFITKDLESADYVAPVASASTQNTGAAPNAAAFTFAPPAPGTGTQGPAAGTHDPNHHDHTGQHAGAVEGQAAGTPVPNTTPMFKTTPTNLIDPADPQKTAANLAQAASVLNLYTGPTPAGIPADLQIALYEKDASGNVQAVPFHTDHLGNVIAPNGAVMTPQQFMALAQNGGAFGTGTIQPGEISLISGNKDFLNTLAPTLPTQAGKTVTAEPYQAAGTTPTQPGNATPGGTTPNNPSGAPNLNLNPKLEFNKLAVDLTRMAADYWDSTDPSGNPKKLQVQNDGTSNDLRKVAADMAIWEQLKKDPEGLKIAQAIATEVNKNNYATTPGHSRNDAENPFHNGHVLDYLRTYLSHLDGNALNALTDAADKADQAGKAQFAAGVPFKMVPQFQGDQHNLGTGSGQSVDLGGAPLPNAGRAAQNVDIMPMIAQIRQFAATSEAGQMFVKFAVPQSQAGLGTLENMQENHFAPKNMTPADQATWRSLTTQINTLHKAYPDYITRLGKELRDPSPAPDTAVPPGTAPGVPGGAAGAGGAAPHHHKGAAGGGKAPAAHGTIPKEIRDGLTTSATRTTKFVAAVAYSAVKVGSTDGELLADKYEDFLANLKAAGFDENSKLYKKINEYKNASAGKDPVTIAGKRELLEAVIADLGKDPAKAEAFNHAVNLTNNDLDEWNKTNVTGTYPNYAKDGIIGRNQPPTQGVGPGSSIDIPPQNIAAAQTYMAQHNINIPPQDLPALSQMLHDASGNLNLSPNNIAQVQTYLAKEGVNVTTQDMQAIGGALLGIKPPAPLPSPQALEMAKRAEDILYSEERNSAGVHFGNYNFFAKAQFTGFEHNVHEIDPSFGAAIYEVQRAYRDARTSGPGFDTTVIGSVRDQMISKLAQAVTPDKVESLKNAEQQFHDDNFNWHYQHTYKQPAPPVPVGAGAPAGNTGGTAAQTYGYTPQ